MLNMLRLLWFGMCYSLLTAMLCLTSRCHAVMHQGFMLQSREAGGMYWFYVGV